MLAKNAIRLFAVVRKAWLFADTSLGARAKANCLECFGYIDHVLERIAETDTVENLEALLPWDAGLPVSKKLAQYG